MAVSKYFNNGIGGSVDPFGNLKSAEDDDFIDEPPVDGTGPSEPPAPPPDDKREDEGETRLEQLNFLIFPPNLRRERSYLHIDIHEETKGSPAVPTIARRICTIGLPVPGNLAEQFQMNYNSIEIGAILGNQDVRNAAGAAVAAFKGRGDSNKKALMEDAGARVKQATETVKGGLVPLMIRNVAKTVDAGLGAIADQIKGGVPNPNLALLYQGHGFRTFQFNWKLIPQSKAESFALARLIAAIKFSMHPSRDGLYLAFPYKAVPKMIINGSDKLFPMKPSVITAFNVNYAPSGNPAFYRNTDLPSPVEVDISMSMQEAEIFTRGDFRESLGFDAGPDVPIEQ